MRLPLFTANPTCVIKGARKARSSPSLPRHEPLDGGKGVVFISFGFRMPKASEKNTNEALSVHHAGIHCRIRAPRPLRDAGANRIATHQLRRGFFQSWRRPLSTR